MPRSGSVTLTDLQEAGHTRLEVKCSLCSKNGSYNLARLLAERGDLRLTDFLSERTADCPHKQGAPSHLRCQALFPALARTAKKPEKQQS